MTFTSHETSEEQFLSAAQQSTAPFAQVARTLASTTIDPLEVYVELCGERDGAFLLESAQQGGVWARYSLVGVSSWAVLTERAGQAVWARPEMYPAPLQTLRFDAQSLVAEASARDESPLEVLQQVWRACADEATRSSLPFTAGFVGYLGWQTIHQIEHLASHDHIDEHIPALALSLPAIVIVIDHETESVTLVANMPLRSAHAPAELWSIAQGALDELERSLQAVATAHPSRSDIATSTTELDWSQVAATHRPGEFQAEVQLAKQHIVDGDVFQVVLSQRFEMATTASAVDVYRELRMLNPSPYLYLLNARTHTDAPLWVVGSSPEALVTVNGGVATTHPIAGSRPRSSDSRVDAAFANELLEDPKERAEHLMLVDLARNDLLKVCEADTVNVAEFMQVERFSHIMHIVSTVEGTVRSGETPVDVFRATFPAGTLSGAPKPRALELIENIERVPRGVYGGVVGYFGFDGNADLAIAIRTAVISNGVVRVQAGAGIVADSDPDSEDLECRNKAAAPLRAVALANARHETAGDR